METTIIILQILIFAVLIFAYFFIKNLLPSYFSEKGKNLATKEDIEDITEKIKTVESKINIKESGEIDYNTLKRRIILDFFGAYNNWERLVTGSNSNHSDEAEARNELVIEKINEAKFNYNLKEGEIEIFIEDSQFYHLRKEVSLKLLKMQNEFEKHCIDISLIIDTVSDFQAKHEKICDAKKKYHDTIINNMKELMPNRNNLISYLEKTLKETFS